MAKGQAGTVVSLANAAGTELDDQSMLRGDGYDWLFTEPPPAETLAPEARRSLTLQEQKFVDEFTKTFDVRKAAIAAGVTTNPHNFFKRQAVRYRVWCAVYYDKQNSDVDRKYVLETLKDIVERAKIAQKADMLNVALKGLEMIGKDLGMFRDPQVVNNQNVFNGNVSQFNFDPSTMTAEELELVHKMAGGDSFKVVEE